MVLELPVVSMEQQLCIGDLVLTIESDSLPWTLGSERPFSSFVVQCETDDIRVSVNWHRFGGQDWGEQIAAVSSETRPEYRLYRDSRGRWIFEVLSGGRVNGDLVFARRVGIFEPDFSRGDLYVELLRDNLPVYPNPMRPPLDRALFVHLVGRRGGMLIHACGVIHRGRGFVFAGPAGSGKSTLARLWSEHEDVTVLGEECLVLRKGADGPRVYGTPWTGEQGLHSAQSAPLAGVFFIRHALQNEAKRTSGIGVAERLLARSYVAPYDPLSVDKVLDFCLSLEREVPMYELGFQPESSTVEWLKGRC